MKSTRPLVLATVVLSLTLGMASSAAAQQTLHGVVFPPNTDVKLQLAPTTQAPSARLEAKVTLREGEARVELKWQDLKPAILFGGDVTCYVLWAVTGDGFAKNLGEVPSGSSSGQIVYATALKSFALMVTAEAYSQVWQPSPLVMFVNDPVDKKNVAVATFTFANFVDAPDHQLDTIRGVSWDDSRPVELVQAERAAAYADRIGAGTYAAAMVQDANLLLAQATNLISSKRQRSNGLEFARRSFGVSSNAIGEAEREIEAERLEQEIASRTAEIEAMEVRAAEAEQSLADARAEREQLESAMNALRTEQAALTSAMVSLRQEKAELSNRLEGALGQVAETHSTARGMIVNLPDILFDVNESTLKPEARLVIAKLAGILLIMQDLNLRVEGHTDSTGPYDYNMKLSDERARSVVQFLAEQGISPSRMVAEGYGPDRPIASNDTTEGRSRNRRVEIVIAEGTVAEALPGS